MTRRGTLIVVAILVAALAIRVVRVESSSSYRPVNDAGSYLTLASQIARTGDYTTSRRPGGGAGGTRGPSAYFPPAYPYLLAAVDVIDGHSTRRGPAIHGARLSQAVLGTVVAGLIGLVALEAFGSVIALVSLALAALYPVLIELSGILVAENLLTALVLAAVWAALRARRSGTPYPWIVAAGVLTGLAALAHGNGILLALPLVFAVWNRPSRLAPVALLAVTALTIAPWTIRNAIVMHRLIPISDQTGITLVGTYNSASAHDPQTPYKWRIFYGIPGEKPLIAQASRLNEPELGSRLEHQAVAYIGQHPLSPLHVGFHNTLRLLELSGSSAWQASAKAMGLRNGIAHTGVVSFWIVGVLALLGAFTKSARAAPRFLWATALLFALSVVLVNVETPRFREPAEPFLILLAACSLVDGARALRRAPVGRDRRSTVSPGDAQLIEVGERLA